MTALPKSPFPGLPVRITTDQYQRMIEQRIIPETAATELVDGIIIHKNRADAGADPMTHGPDHILAVALLCYLAGRINGPDRHLLIQLPVSMAPVDEPEPDAMIVRGRPRDYTGRKPAPADVSCVIEVASSSLKFDSSTKLQKYARAGIPQYVIINIPAKQVEAYSEPDEKAERYVQKAIVPHKGMARLNLGMGQFLDVPASELLP